MAAVAFVGTTVVLRSIQGPLKAPTLRAQVEAFLAEKDDIDAVFVGSSRVQRGVSPSVIDERVSTAKHPFRSFNLGIAGMRSFEADWLIRQVLDSKPERLRFLVIEVPDWEPELAPRHDFTERYVEWHDARATWLELRAIWRQGVSIWRRLELSWRALRFFLMRSSNYATVYRFNFGEDPVWERLVLGWGQLQGYQPLDEHVAKGARRRAKFLSNPQLFEAAVARLRKLAEAGPPVAAAALERYDRGSLEDQVRYVDSRGVTPVYLVPPLLYPVADFSALAREGVIPHLIDLKNPLLHPELFDADNRFDREHMNEEGARMMSEKIAEQLAPLILQPTKKRN